MNYKLWQSTDTASEPLTMEKMQSTLEKVRAAGGLTAPTFNRTISAAADELLERIIEVEPGWDEAGYMFRDEDEKL